MFFDGSVKSRRVVSLGGASSRAQNKSTLVEDKRAARAARELEAKHQKCARKIQAFYRSRAEIRLHRNAARHAWDANAAAFASATGAFHSVADMHTALRSLVFFASEARQDDWRRVEQGARAVIQAVQQQGFAFQSYLEQDSLRMAGFVLIIKQFLAVCVRTARAAVFGGADSTTVDVLLKVLVVMSEERVWNSPAQSSQIIQYRKSVMSSVAAAGLFETIGLILERAQDPAGSFAIAAIELSMRLLDASDPSSLARFALSIFCLPSFSSFPAPVIEYVRANLPMAELLPALAQHLPGEIKSLERITAQSLALLGNIVSMTMDTIAELPPSSAAAMARVLLPIVRALPKNVVALASAVQSAEGDDDLDSDEEATMQAIGHIEPMAWARGVKVMSPHFIRRLWQTMGASPPPDSADIAAVAELLSALIFRFKTAREDVLNTVAFAPRILRQLWLSACGPTLLDPLLKGRSDDRGALHAAGLLGLFSSGYAHLLKTVEDAELFNESSGRALFAQAELVSVIQVLRDVVVSLFLVNDPTMESSELAPADVQRLLSVRHELSALLWDLRERDIRVDFCPPQHWLHPSADVRPEEIPLELFDSESEEAVSAPSASGHETPTIGRQHAPTPRHGSALSASSSSIASRAVSLLRELPFVVPFVDRVRILQRLIDRDKLLSGRDHPFFASLSAKIRRPFIYEDGFSQLNKAGLAIKGRIRIALVDEHGLDEAGIDGGGLFKEFLTEFVKHAFDPTLGFFVQTEENFLYPNPNVSSVHPDYVAHYEFIGRMVGKAMYERILVELPFAAFFLSKIRNRPSNIGDLASLDRDLHKHLFFVKNYTGDFADLALTFSVGDDRLGSTRIVDLIPNGRNVDVTRQNRLQYIFLVANYRLNVSIRAQSAAFMRGLSDVMELKWLSLFDEDELRVIISGAETAVDLDDLRRHTNYGNGFTDVHPTIAMFWRVVALFSREQKRKLLKFATSCSRPPLLGFRELYPPFLIQNAGSASEGRLPTASTCMNVLKLPEFTDERTLREKLLYSIESGAGFDLS